MSATAPFTTLEYRTKVLTDLSHGPYADRALLAREALERLRDGSFGFCTRCGLKVPEARLDRGPEQPYCARCE